MTDPATLLRDSRRRAGLTQRQLALRLGVSQAAIAKLERPAANPTFATLAGALWATGHRLELEAPARHGGVDDSLAAERLEDRRRSTELSRRAEERWRGFLDTTPLPSAAAAPLGEQELIELGGTLRKEA